MTAEAMVIDFRKSAVPLHAVGGRQPFPETRLPRSGHDPRRGLHFPLPPGDAVVFQSRGKLSDESGAISVTFSFDREDKGGELVETWTRYFHLTVRRAEHEVVLTAYGHDLILGWRFSDGVEYTLEASWDCRVGLALRLNEAGHLVRQVACNLSWQPYRSRWMPIAIGGQLASTEPGKRDWHNTFHGWVTRFTCYTIARWAPGLPRISVSAGETGKHGSAVIPPASGITVLEVHNPPIQDSPIRFDLIPDRLGNFRRCRRMHPELEELYFGAPTAFAGLVNVTRYVAGLWAHCDYWPWPREIFTGRGDTLLTHIKRGETAGMCGGYAHTMEEILWALGVPARRTQVYGHSSFEAYDHTHDKWVCLEADPAGQPGYWESLEGVPLSIGEMVAINEEDLREPGTLQRRVRHVLLGVQLPGGAARRMNPEYMFRHCYTHIGFYKGDYLPERQRHSFWYIPAGRRLSHAEPWSPLRMQHLLDDWRPLYWSCDRVRVAAAWQRRGEILALRFSPFQAQFLAGYAVRVDDGPERHVGARFDWHLHPGVNRISVATRNRLGATGHPWRAVVHRGE